MNAWPSTRLSLPTLPTSWRDYLPGDMLTGYEYFAWPLLPAAPTANREEVPAPPDLDRFAETQLE